MKFYYQLYLLLLLITPSFAVRIYVIEGNNALSGQNANWVILENGSSDPNAQNATNFGVQDFNFSVFKEYRIRGTGSQSVTFNDGQANQSQFKVYKSETLEEITFPLTVEPAEEFTFKVRFIPGSRETVTARIQFRSANAKGGYNEYHFRVGGSGAGGEIFLQGRGSPDLNFLPIPSELNSTFLRENGTLFQPTNANQNRTHEFSITNTAQGTGDPLVKDTLRISEAILTGGDSSQFEIIGIPNTLNLGGDTDPLQEALFQIRYNPTSEGTHTATLEIQTNDLQTNPFQFRLQGISPPLTDFSITGRPASSGATTFLPILASSTSNSGPQTSNGTVFPTTSVGTLSEALVQLENSGAAPLLIHSITIAGEFANQFRITSLPDTISEGSASTFGIIFEPTSNGLKTATVNIDTNGLEGGLFSFSIRGNGTAPILTFSGETDYGEVGLNKTATRSFRISNTGAKTLIISNATLIDTEAKEIPEWNILSQVFPRSVQPGTSINLAIEYSPKDADSDVATLIVESNDPLSGIQNIDLSGEAILETELLAFGSIGDVFFLIDDEEDPADQPVTDFGPVELDQTTEKTFRILSSGTKDLLITSITSSHPAFVIEATLEVLAPGNHLDFTVTYTPGIVADELTVIHIESDGIGELATYSFSLKGSGTGPKLALYGGLVSDERLIRANELTPSPLNFTDFGFYRVGSAPIALPIIVKNVGDRELTITDLNSFNPLFKTLLEPSVFPIVLGPAEERIIEFTFEAESVQEAISIIVLESDDRSVAEGSYYFAVRASAEAASPVAPELDVSISESQQPSSSEFVDLWYLVGAPSPVTSFTLSNTGGADLMIRAITSSNPNFQYNFDLVDMAPGTSRNLIVSNNPSSQPNTEETTIKIYSSSATKSIYTLNIRTNFVQVPQVTAVERNQEGEFIVTSSNSLRGFDLTTATRLDSPSWVLLDSNKFSTLENPDRINLGALSSTFPEDKTRFFRLELKRAGQ